MWKQAGLGLTLVALAGACLPRTQPHDPSAAGAETAEPEFVSPEFNETRADLDAAIQKATEGYAPGDKLSGKLDGFAPHEIPVSRGTCYVGALVLDDGAAFGDHARKGATVESTLPGGPKITHADAIHGPGAVFDLGCPEAAGKATVDLIAVYGSAMDSSQIHELGKGGYTLLIYGKSISEADLVALKAQAKALAEQQAEEQRTFAEQERQRDEQLARDRAELSAAAPARGGGAERSGSQGPQVVSVSLRSRCGKTVKVFFGKEPKFGSGTTSSIGGNSVQNHSFRPGDMVWLVDDSGKGIASATASPGMREIEISSSCTGLTSR
jgi:hypothetical protein